MMREEILSFFFLSPSSSRASSSPSFLSVLLIIITHLFPIMILLCVFFPPTDSLSIDFESIFS